MDERRQLPRWEIKKEAKVWLPETQGFCHCIVEDMHLKGMRVSLTRQLYQQEPLEMSFSIGDNDDLINVESLVSWKQEDQGRYVYGLSFSNVDDVDKDKIYQYINANCYEQFKNRWWA